MAFDGDLAGRIRTALDDVPDVREQRMFGGLAFMVRGHMACGLVGDQLMLRLGEQGADAALDEPHVRPMDFTGKPMGTMVFVEPTGIATQTALDTWIGRAWNTSRPCHPRRGGPDADWRSRRHARLMRRASR